MKSVFIIIVNWNGKTDTLNCLSSLSNISLKDAQVQIIVVDNASTDESADAIAKSFPSVRIIENTQNLGFTGGNNIGMRIALREGADFVWLLNNDTTVHKAALGAFLAAMGDKTVGIAGSKIYFSAGREYHKNRYRANERGNVIWYAGGLLDWNNVYASHKGVDEVDHGQFEQVEETAFITGCSMFIRKEVIDTIGFFDDRYYLYLEDVDYSLRAKRAGFRLLYVPKSIIWHVNAGSSGGPGSQTHEYYQTRNRLFLGMKYARIKTKIALLKESLKFVIGGPKQKRKAVVDFLLNRWGNQAYVVI